MTANPFGISAIQLINNAPFLLAVFAGAVICMVRESRPLRVRVAVGAALVIQLGFRMVMPLVYNQVHRMLQAGKPPTEGPFLVVNFVLSVIFAATLAVLLWAAFTNDDRPPAVTA